MQKALMGVMATQANQTLTNEKKTAALESVLQSQTFARTDQLKCFLKYVCEMEMAGRGHELTEYLIGIEALGRPASYSPGDDSAVRTRAFALRKKLQEFYEHEQPEAPVRIDLLKGSYCPHFVESRAQQTGGSAAGAEPHGQPPVAEPVAHEELPTPTRGKRVLQAWKDSRLLVFSSGVVVTALLAAILYWTKTESVANKASVGPPPVMAEAWGPLLANNADVLLCVANPPSFSVLPGPFSPPPPQAQLSGERPLPRELYELYATRYPTAGNLTLTVTTNATYWGDVLAALTASRTLSAAGVSAQMFPEMVTTMPTLRRRNVILFGAPAYSPAVAHFLEECPLKVNYLDAIVGRATEQPQAARYALRRDQRERLTQVFGLITVLPGETTDNRATRIFIFSGVNSAGTQAASEFFSSPEHLLELKAELKKAGHDTFPPAYQVVVRAETDDSILLKFHYEAFRIIPQSTSH